MVITDELIAAYIDGNVTVEERRQVRRYLAAHPEAQDLILALMDKAEKFPEEANISLTATLEKEEAFTDIAYAAAAFAPRKVIRYEATPKVFISKSQERHLRMSALWNELQENK